MAFSIDQARKQARRVIHDHAAVLAVYTDNETPPEGVELRVRWHTKHARTGNPLAGYDAEILTGINRLVFDSSELTSKGVALARGGVVDLIDPDTRQPTASFELDAEDDPDGPQNVYWLVTRQL